MNASKPIDPAAREFGAFLRSLREARGLSLRGVEEATGRKLSNGYLSQLENGQVSRPSAVTIHTLSAAYGVEPSKLMDRAGLAADVDVGINRMGSLLGDVSLDEEAELLRYLAFIRQRSS